MDGRLKQGYLKNEPCSYWTKLYDYESKITLFLNWSVVLSLTSLVDLPYPFYFVFADIKLTLLKLTWIEQQQQHQTRLLQNVLEVLQATEKDSGEMPSDVNLPLTTVAALKAVENKLESEEFYKQMVKFWLVCLSLLKKHYI